MLRHNSRKMKKLLFLGVMAVTLQLHAQVPILLRNVFFLDEELDVRTDSSGHSISWHSNFPSTNYRFILMEFSTDIPYNSNLPFELFLHSGVSNDTIPLKVCDTLYYEDGKTILRAYCAINENDIPGGRKLLLKDVFNDYTYIVDSMKQAYSILYYEKKAKLFSNIVIPQIVVIPPRLSYSKKILFRKCYCPIEESHLKESFFENNSTSLGDEE